ncbi:SDR family oxidoreductase [Marinobacterium jannaschii]|uniref:SDR family oxidoreductase n=1 Tax=Marinobacterium jannaschii TaxID=64970 RepID=UPI000487679A|nr:SDR family oxidoreductase [Marinobacterium jannaschii]
MQQRVFITAAAAGIGRAIAIAFCDAGARVHICDIDGPALETLAASQPQISYSVTDVGDEAQVEQFFRDGLEQLGGIDVLVNNAGIGGPAGTLETLNSAAWQQTIQLNLNSTFYACKQALPYMKAQGSGSIVNLSSTAGIMGYPLRTPYAAAKWAVTGLTKSLAMECGGDGIRVNAICPGAVSGERMDRVIGNEAAARNLSESQVRESYVSQCSMKTFVDPEDIAAMALFLSSTAGARISGQIISVDGDTHTLA